MLLHPEPSTFHLDYVGISHRFVLYSIGIGISQFPPMVNPITTFTALHVMHTRYSDENSVRQSVCPSVCHTRGL